MKARCLLFVSLLLVTGFAPAPFLRTGRSNLATDDLRKLQGTWAVVKWELDGDDLTELTKEVRFTFDGDRLAYSMGDYVGSRWYIELSSMSAPRAITRTSEDKQRVKEGIYRLEGDRLIICEGKRGRRPTQFNSVGRFLLIEMRRL
jgi:uncharacterized protein (TIGR03067 family)